jgi:hypothetical protein
MLKTVSSIVNAIGALNYKGTWNASTNTPALASGVGTKGDYYVVSVAGSTTLDGISNWGIGDWAAYNGTTWQRVEGGADLNGVNLSVSGTTTLSALTASTALALDASKNAVSVTNTGTGDNVLATAPTLVGDVTLSTGNLVIGASGKGINTSSAIPVTFNINNTEAARIHASRGVSINNTTDPGAANLSVSGKIFVNRNADGSSGAAYLYATTIPSANIGVVRIESGKASDSADTALSVIKNANDSTTAQVYVRFLMNAGNGVSGQINANGASQAAFGSFSDSRLKENIVDLPPQLANITALRPVEFDYIESEGGGHQIGFVAQEMREIYPDAVGERSDGMLTVTGWSKTEARLVKAIQEQQKMIEDLKKLIEIKG